MQAAHCTNPEGLLEGRGHLPSRKRRRSCQIREGILALKYIPTRLNFADLFTKVIKLADSIHHRDALVKDPVLL